MKVELLPFIDSSVASYQKMLSQSDKIEELRIEVQEEKDQLLIDKGIERGLKGGIEQVAMNLLRVNMPIEDIMKVTGLDENRLSELKENMR
ncbi:hypothetical protein [Candidatus Cytomitobacter primus]|nr:hypothetical protein [Candidatus Cytomitobacter primus]